LKRYALVGCGIRGLSMYAAPIVRHYSDVAQLVAICDTNVTRIQALRRYVGVEIPAFTEYAAMLRESCPDTVIIASVDSTHAAYLIEALDAGCDAITEKPMVIDDVQARAVLACERRTGKRVIVTFNYRYSPAHQQLRRLLAQDVIGRIISIDFHWYLDRIHGADYFRRWDRVMENSGGLLVHKASHHFDLVNWWTASEPVEVYASGRLAFYGATRVERGERCLTCGHKQTCEFYLDLAEQEHLRALYLDAEGEDGYHRDACVFADEIDIYDTMAATIRYSNGASMSYSLNAFAPYEGYSIAINGDLGRLEQAIVERAPGRQPSASLRLLRAGTPAEDIPG
jgi:predicted dehydrogenase